MLHEKIHDSFLNFLCGDSFRVYFQTFDAFGFVDEVFSSSYIFVAHGLCLVEGGILKGLGG
jgi:hypothetical protein